ncbi:MAG: hypothetical protein WC933_03315 [Candidatus Paceibacterota bacterium]|jgi:5'-3' exonuclease
MKYTTIIIDCNNLYHANYYTRKEEKQVAGKSIPVGTIEGTFLSIQKLEREFLEENGKVYCLADNPLSTALVRKEIDPSYKINRIKQNNEFYRGIDYLLMILESYKDNYYIVRKDKVEADDCVPPIILTLDKEERILLVSSDMDWARCINYQGYNVDWNNRKEIITKKEFNNKYGFDPNEQKIITFKCFRGDKSDFIDPGVLNIPTDILFQLLDYGTIFDIIRDCHYIPFLSQKWKDEIYERKGKLYLNYQLISFVPISPEDIKFHTLRGKRKKRSLKILYESLGLAIDKIDKVLYTEIVEEESKKLDDFFEQPTIRRV